MNAPKISIIIPVYKVEKYIAKTIELILKQNFSDFELILVDDGSPDNSGAICDEYSKKDSRIKVFHQENQGAGAARNTGLDNARGDFISFIDADDEIPTDYIDSIVENFKKNKDSDLLIFEASCLRNGSIENNYLNQTNIDKEKVINQKDFHKKSFFILTPLIWNKCFKRDLIEKNNIRFQNIKSCNDHYFAFISIALSKNISYLNKELYCYNIDSEFAISRTRAKSSLCVIDAGVYLKEKLKELNLFNDYKENLYDFYFRGIFFEYLKSYNRKELLIATKKLFSYHIYIMFLLKTKLIKVKYKLLSILTTGQAKEKYTAIYDRVRD